MLCEIQPCSENNALDSELGCCENSSKVDESMKFGMMVGIDHTNKFRLVGMLKYA